MGESQSPSEVGYRVLEPSAPVLRGGAVAKYCLLGAPMVARFLPMPWQDVRTPRFPVLFPATGAYALGIFSVVTAVVVTAVIGPPDFEELAQWVGYWFAAALLLFLVAEMVNGVLLLWCRALLAVGARLKKARVLPSYHVQRVIYFSSLWQSVALVCWSLLWPGAFWGNEGLPGALGVLGELTLAVALLLRLFSLFYGLLRSGTGVALAGAGVVGAVDAWCLGAQLVQRLARW